jgi:hypothetical protein
MPRLKVKGWEEFQHYKHRSPPWIKLHKKLLDNFEYHCLPLASRALAPMLWLIASESDDGSIEFNIQALSFRLRVSEKDIKDAVIPLIDKGFLIDASGALAQCMQDDSELLLQSRVEAESERETEHCANGFNEFWFRYPKKVGKDAAKKAWQKKKPRIDDVMFALSWQINSDQWSKSDGQFIPNPATYINQGRWQDEMPQEVTF